MKQILILAFLFATNIINAQILLETVDGEEIMLNPVNQQSGLLLGGLNVTDQSVQFKSIFTLKNSGGVVPKQYISVGVKGKPSDGIATLFSGGNFNPHTEFNLSYTKMRLFTTAARTSAIDFFTIRLNYNIIKSTLLYPDSSFSKQVKNFNFHGFSATFNYNILISGRNLLNLSIGYARNNNYSRLDTYDMKEYYLISDNTSNKIKEYGKTINGRIGDYKEYNSYPVKFAYVFCPSLSTADLKKLKIGFSFYYSTELGKRIPLHNLGGLIFLTKQNVKSGIRAPIVGLGLQLSDFTDNQNKNHSLTKNISFTLSTTIPILSFK